MDLNDPSLYLNRELSWIAFNERVLGEALDTALPLYERLKFMGIVSSNLDEFFMVRVAGLKQQLASGVADVAADGMLPAAQLQAIGERVHAMVGELYSRWNDDLLPKLAANGIHLLSRQHLAADQRKTARSVFVDSVFPALTPLAVDSGHPFPHLRNKSLNLVLKLRRESGGGRRDHRQTAIAVVQVPSVLPRLIRLPVEKGQGYLLLEDLIAAHADELFTGFKVEQAAAFRVTRNWDLHVDDEDSDDLLSSIQDELKRRDRGNSVRLEIHDSASPELEEFLTTALKLDASDVYRVSGPLQLGDLGHLSDADPRPELRVESFAPVTPNAIRDADSLVSLIAQRDLMLRHPYESFDPVARFISEAAEDPDVLAIKQTLYRISPEGRIARALSRAAENGKQVAVLVEIQARLDEANNITWARRMEEAGVHVVYGMLGLKTHCKAAMVVRREGAGIRRYVHLGTGNYNHQTARLYTDVSLFTARTEIADDVSALFNTLTGYATAPHWKRLAVAPLTLHDRVVHLIERETERAKRKEPARIVAKLNSLVDPSVIRALYAASQAGVEIDLLIRGICCLRPQIEGISERIRVTSVVDRFLEHSRIFAFGVGKELEVFLSSADWMPRNFYRRIEVLWPVEDPTLKSELMEDLHIFLEDNVKARQLLSDGRYVAKPQTGPVVRSQVKLMDRARLRSGPPAEAPIRQVPAPSGAPEAARSTGAVVRA